MSDDDYFQRLKYVIDGLQNCTYDDENYWEYSIESMNLKFEALVRNFSFTDEQESFVRKAAIDHLSMGKKGEFHILCDILSYTGSRIQRKPTETSLQYHFDFKEDCASSNDIAIDLLIEAGIFASDEKVQYYDIGTLGVQKKDVGRRGLLIVTNKRLIAVGGYTGNQYGKKHKLYYGDLREPYLSYVDFVYLDRLKDIELKKKKIQAKYDTEYIVEKERTFYGPYFFRFDLPTSVKVKSGSVKIKISLPELEKKELVKKSEFPFMDEAFERWNEVEIPENYDLVRLNNLYRMILK